MRIAILTLVLCVPAVALAQDRGAAVGGSVSAANMSSHTDVALGVTFGYRFSRVVELELEGSWVPSVHSDFPANPILIQNATAVTTIGAGAGANAAVQIFPTPYYANPDGRIVMFTNGVRINIPTTAARMTPYFAAGGGVAAVRRTSDFVYPVLVPLASQLPTQTPTLRPITQQIVSSETDLAVTLGGGVDIRITSALSLEADLRLFRLLGEEDRNLGRFGAGVRYRF